MKKIILIAAVAIAAAACSKTFETNLATEKAIGFGTWAETMTKAYDGSNWVANTDAFKVYGSKKVGTTVTPVFEGDVVTFIGKINSNDTWTYSPLKFWDLAADSYTFYAFLPEDALSTGTTAGVFASEPITFANPTETAEDILVASEYTRSRTAGSLMNTDAVQLAFNHMASLVDVKVKKAESIGDVTVKVTAASLTGIYNEGTLNVTGYDATTKKPTYDGFGWNPGATPSTDDYVSTVPGTSGFVVPAVTTYSGVDATTTTPATFDGIFANYILMPQDLTNGQKLTINYTISAGDGASNDYTATIDLKDFVASDKTNNDATPITGWMPGVHYTYYLTISAKEIVFTASVNDWAVESAYHYLVK